MMIDTTRPLYLDVVENQMANAGSGPDDVAQINIE